MTIGERIRQLRTARGLSQEELARLSSDTFNGKHIGRYEAGKRDPRWYSLQAIARGLGVTVAELVEGCNDE